MKEFAIHLMILGVFLAGYALGVFTVWNDMRTGDSLQEFTSEQVRDVMTVELVTDPAKVAAVLNKQRKPASGVAVIAGERCIIYAFEPEKIHDDKMLTFGHEIAHCFYNNFHKQYETY